MTDPEEIIGHYTDLPNSNIVDTVNNHTGSAQAISTAQWYVMDFMAYFGKRASDGKPEGPWHTSSAFYEYLDAAIQDAYTGHYAPAFSCLRNALETGLFAVYWEADAAGFGKWMSGDLETPWNRHLFASLRGHPRLDAMNAQAGTIDLAFALMGSLDDYAHSRPNIRLPNGGLQSGWSGEWWKSNGPIYVAEAFDRWFEDYRRTVTVVCVIWAAAFPDILSMQPDAWEADTPQHNGQISVERIGDALGWPERTRDAFDIIVKGGLP
ncbi:MAG: hypothetical protein ACE149_06895 [Armatimonadota bacterium]